MSIKTALKVGISISCLAFLYFQIEGEQILLMLQHTDIFEILWMLMLLCALNVLQSIRWWLIGTKLELRWPVWLAIELAFIGSFFSQILPSSVGGDAVRAWMLTRFGYPIQKAVNSIILDRASAILSIGLIICAGSSVLFGIIGKNIGTISLSLPYVFMISFLFILLFALVFVGLKSSYIRQYRVVELIANFIRDTKEVFLAPSLVLLTTVISLVIQLTVGYIVWCLALSYGAKFDFIEFSLLWPIVLLLTALPISIAGWGVREGALVVAFKILENPSGSALATSITFGILMALASMPGGIIWVILTSKKSLKTR